MQIESSKIFKVQEGMWHNSIMKINFKYIYSILLIILATYIGFSLISGDTSKLETMKNKFPTVTGNNLNKEKIMIPNDVNDKPVVIVLAFQRYHQITVDEIISQIENEFSSDEVNIIETPILEGSSKLFQIYLDGIMRGGIPDYDTRARTITIYGNKKEMLDFLNIDDKNVYWYLVDKNSSNILLNSVNTLSNNQLSELKTLIKN